MITVAEYKRPKFEITFNSLKDAYKLGDQLTVSGIAKTYSGGNIENSKVTYTVQARTFDWGLQENMTGFIVRQNPAIDLCIRYGLKATCKGMRPRAAES